MSVSIMGDGKKLIPVLSSRQSANLKPTRRAGRAESIKKILGRVLNRIKAQKHLSMPCAAAHGKQQSDS